MEWSLEFSKITEGLKEDEKALVAAFGLERLYKKHKIKIWIIIAAIVLFFVGKIVMDTIETAKIQKANDALARLEANPNDREALKLLKENKPKLYDLYLFAQAAKEKNAAQLKSLAKSDEPVIADSATYHHSLLEKKPTDSVLYEDMVFLQKATIAIKQGDKAKAKEILERIPKESPAYQIATILKHATIKVQ